VETSREGNANHDMQQFRECHTLLVIQCVSAMNNPQVKKLEPNTALNAKTEQFATAKISDCANVSSKTSRAE